VFFIIVKIRIFVIWHNVTSDAFCITEVAEYQANLRKPLTDGICVCVKPLDFPSDISAWLVEWIEASQMLGAAKIVIYIYQVSISHIVFEATMPEIVGELNEQSKMD